MDAAAFHTNTGAYRIYAVIKTFHSYFGSFAGIANDFANDDQSIKNFGNLYLEQLCKKFGACAAENYYRCIIFLINPFNYGTNASSFFEEVAWYLFRFGQY